MNKKTTEELELLFAFAPPKELKRSLNQLFYAYIIRTEILPEDYKKTAEDIYFLMKFLERMEDLNH